VNLGRPGHPHGALLREGKQRVERRSIADPPRIRIRILDETGGGQFEQKLAAARVSLSLPECPQ
jgi:hypothetical protein